jgi:hypothetical protein
MHYQVMIKRSGIAGWRYVTLPTSDLHRAHVQFQTAKRYNAGALLLAARSLLELAQLTQRLSSGGGDIGTHTRAAQYPIPAVTTQRNWRGANTDPRWELERGPGGDRDEPYRFEPPASETTRLAWAHLLARANLEWRSYL